MDKVKKIDTWDLPDTLDIPNGYDWERAPDLTRANLEYLINEHNKLVDIVNNIMNGRTLNDG